MFDVDALNELPGSATRPQTFVSGECIFRQGEATSGFYWLRSGVVELHRTTADGTLIVLHRAEAGESFAEASLFAEHYHCDAIARSTSSVVSVSKSDALRLLQQGSFASDLVAHLSAQVQHYRILLQLCSIRRADERIYAAMKAGLNPKSWKSFAPQIGLSHEAVYRGLSSLVKRGLVERQQRGVYRLR